MRKYQVYKVASLEDIQNKIAAPDAIPQERITGDILRGHGPRRGGLEKLLKFWRPVMRKPGGFRRCLVILADHPELYPLQRICAWLHHETTGLWPNEGNHHGGGRAASAARRGGRAKLRRTVSRARKKVAFSTVEMVSVKSIDKLLRPSDSVFYEPINGRQNLVLYKTAVFAAGYKKVPIGVEHVSRKATDQQYAEKKLGSALVSAVPYLEAHPFRVSPVRRVGYNLLTPGGNSRLTPGVGGARRTLGGVSSRARRCPAGFSNGGRFANRQLSNCGNLIYSISDEVFRGLAAGFKLTKNPTPAGGGAGRRQGLTAGSIVEDLRKRPNGFDTSRLALVPDFRGENLSALKKSVANIAKDIGTGDGKRTRLVRADGLILSPAIPLSKLVNTKPNRDFRNGAVVQSVDSPSKIGQEAVPMLMDGLQQAVFVVPNKGTITMERERPIPSRLAPKIKATISSAFADTSDDTNFDGALVRIAAEYPDIFTVTHNFPGIKEPTKLNVVGKGSSEKRVPAWAVASFSELGSARAAVESTESGKSFSAALKDVNAGGDLFDVPSHLLESVVAKSRNVKVTSSGKDKLFTDKAGRKYILKGGDDAISYSTAADLYRALGVDSPRAKIVGGNKRSGVLLDVPKTDGHIDSLDEADRIRIALASILVDDREGPLKVIPSQRDGKQIGVVTGRTPYLPTKADLEKRRKISVPQFIKENQAANDKLLSGVTVDAESAAGYDKVVKELIAKAEKFSFDDYAKKLAADGFLSEAEKIHLNLIAILFKSRLDNLRRRKDNLSGGGSKSLDDQRSRAYNKARIANFKREYHLLSS